MGAPVIAGTPPASVSGAATEATLLQVLANQTNGLQLAVVDVTDRPGRILGHITVDNFPATQPISAVALPLPAGAATEATLANVVAGIAAMFARQADGTQKAFITNFPATQAVSAAALPLPAGAATEATLATRATEATLATRLADATVTARLNTLGQKTMALSAPVVIASDQSSIPVTLAAVPLPAGAATEATLATRATEATLATRLADATVTARLNTLGQKTMALSAPVVLASDQSAIPITPPTLTKGTQGATGVSVQSLIDAGRARVAIVFQAVAPAVADTLLTLVKITAGVAAGGATSIGVASGKTLRIIGIEFSIRAGAAAAAFGTLNIRQNPVGATVLASQSELRIDLGNTAAVIGAADKISIALPDGWEFSGTQTLGASLAAQAVTNTISIALIGFEY